jgi:Uma2 family endonuclease
MITELHPDSVRGPDVSFYSYAKLPNGPLPEGFPSVLPDLVVEVLAPSDRWPEILAKVAEYLNADVATVCVLDPDRRTLHLYEGELPGRILGADEELTLPGLPGDFRVPIRRFLD